MTGEVLLPARRVALLLLGLATAAASSGCPGRQYYQNPPHRGGLNYGVATHGNYTGPSGEEGIVLHPALVEYLIAHPGSNVGFFYERMAVWGDLPEEDWGNVTARLEYGDRRDRLEQESPKEFEAAAKDPKKMGDLVAHQVGRQVAPAVAEAIFDRGYAGVVWGPKPDTEGPGLKIAYNGFWIYADPGTRIVTIFGSTRKATMGTFYPGLFHNFDVSRIPDALVVPPEGTEFGAAWASLKPLTYEQVAKKVKYLGEKQQ